MSNDIPALLAQADQIAQANSMRSDALGGAAAVITRLAEALRRVRGERDAASENADETERQFRVLTARAEAADAELAALRERERTAFEAGWGYGYRFGSFCYPIDLEPGDVLPPKRASDAWDDYQSQPPKDGSLGR